MRYFLWILLACFFTDAIAEEKLQADKIVILKNERLLSLYQDGKEIRSYKIALGTNPEGPKTQEGDGKTPEGIYSISGRNAASRYHRALRISYPNSHDRQQARKRGVSPGGDIMIHGLPNGKGAIGKAHIAYDWTIGCIAVTDEEIEEIWELVPNGTTVEIKP